MKKALPQIAHAIDLIAAALSQGGRLIYVGTGTSGRIAALDAVECPPTFDIDPRMVQFIIAGGPKALAAAVEADEDSRELGRKAIAKKKPTKKMSSSASRPADALPSPSPPSSMRALMAQRPLLSSATRNRRSARPRT